AGARVVLLSGEPNSPAEVEADLTVSLEFAPEHGVIQTRFVVAATFALRLLGGAPTTRAELVALPAQAERALAEFDPTPLLNFRPLVYLGRGGRYGVAQAAAVNLQETSLLVPEGHQTLEYRHGPIASAGEQTLVWCFDPSTDAESAGVLDEVRATGATVRVT